MNTNREVDTATKVYETAQRFQQISKISNPISSNKVPNKDGKIDIPSRFGNNDNCFYIYITVAIEDQFKDPTLGKIIIKAPTLSDPLLLKLISKACIDFVHTNFNHAMYNLKQLVEADGVLQKNPYDKDALKTFRDCGNTIHRINATFDRYFEIIF